MLMSWGEAGFEMMLGSAMHRDTASKVEFRSDQGCLYLAQRFSVKCSRQGGTLDWPVCTDGQRVIHQSQRVIYPL